MSRSVKKGPFIEKSLYKKIIEMNKESDKKMIKTYSRCSTIIPEMVGNTISVPVVAQGLTNPTRNHEVAGSVPALAQWVNDPALP